MSVGERSYWSSHFYIRPSRSASLVSPPVNHVSIPTWAFQQGFDVRFDWSAGGFDVIALPADRRRSRYERSRSGQTSGGDVNAGKTDTLKKKKRD